MRSSVAPPAPKSRRMKSTQERCPWSDGPSGTTAVDIVVVVVVVVSVVKGAGPLDLEVMVVTVVVVAVCGDCETMPGAKSRTALKAPLSMERMS